MAEFHDSGLSKNEKYRIEVHQINSDYDRKIKEKAASDKIEIYNKDLKKLASKAVTRDDALDKILKDSNAK